MTDAPKQTVSGGEETAMLKDVSSAFDEKTVNELDLNFYRNYYDDLGKLNDEELIHHWNNFGKAEGRHPNLSVYVTTSPQMQFALDLDFYTLMYPDLKESNIATLEEAKFHWLHYGKKEKRLISIEDWYTKNKKVGVAFDITKFCFKEILSKNSDLNIKLADILDTALGSIGKPIKFYNNVKDNASFYKRIGNRVYRHYKNTLDGGKLQNARNAWRISGYFQPSTEVMQIIANSYFEQGDFRTAQKALEHGYTNDKRLSAEGLNMLVGCYEALRNFADGLAFIQKYSQDNPSETFLVEKIDQLTHKLYEDNLGEMQVLGNLDNRDGLIACTDAFSEEIYNSYFNYYANRNTVTHSKRLNTNRVLIIGDFHIPQCVRYRITQKVEQLQSQGIDVTTVDWSKLADNFNEVALHDIVIFYRTPATPIVLKALGLVNANNKASFFEIDDLLFEPSYPAPLDTFGGFVDIATHIELRKAPANFKAVAKRCMYGIASTELLRQKLEKLVMSKTCVLHRNGLDKLNYFANLDKKDKATLDIFYGSGTQAHNTDFIELAVPALTQIMTEYSHVRLIIVGYLELPESFKHQFENQLITVPPIKNVRAYWNLLEQADINLAVLVDDEVNGCKSELKWFEAACLGIPSVVSSTANYRDVISDGKDAFIASNPQEWKKALQSLVESADLRRKIAATALKKVKTQYSVAKLGESLISNIESLTKQKAANKKKIALVNVFFPPQSIGGATRVLADNFDVLQQQYGNEFELVVFTSDERCTTPYQLDAYQHEGITVYRSTILYRENMDWHPKDENMYSLFERFLELEKPDLVHFHCVQRLSASVVEATKDNNIPYIVTAHDAWWISDHQFLVDQKDNVYPEGHPDIFEPRVLPKNVTLDQSIERLNYFKELLNGARHLLTVSESFSKIYAKNGYPQIKVNKNGINTTVKWAEKQTTYTENVVCAHIGGMAAHKGYYLFKEAIESAQPSNIEILVVDHSKAPGYEHKTVWGVVNVTFVGRVNQDDVVTLYQKIDVLFAPSLWPESYGLVTREAAACGCWAVASNLGGIGEDITPDEGFCINPTLAEIERVINVIDKSKLKYKQPIALKRTRAVTSQVKELIDLYND